MAIYGLIQASGLPPRVRVTVRKDGREVDLFSTADGVGRFTREVYTDDAGATQPKVYAPNGTYTLGYAGGSTTVTVSGASAPTDTATDNSQGQAPDTASATYATQARAVPAEAALRTFRVASQKGAMTTAPTVTLSSDLPAATPVGVPASNGTGSGDLYTSLATNRYTFLGGRQVKASVTFPGYNGVRRVPQPAFPAGKGNGIAECVTDAPAFSVQQSLAEGGFLRVLVDDIEVFRSGPALRTGTAQAGGASTITLDAGASATNDVYFTRWIRITAGTGAGQTRQISGYVGSTKVATVNTAWSTPPDNTSVFEIAYGRRDNNTASGTGYALFDFAGERRMRKVRVEYPGTTFYGLNVTSAIDTVAPAEPTGATVTIWSGDSYSGTTFNDGAIIDGTGAVACALLGWSPVLDAIGGSGYLNPPPLSSATNLNAKDRLLPPTNAWLVQNSGTGGTFTLTQGGVTTAAIAYNASTATLRAALDAAFGASSFDVAGDAGVYYIIGRSAPTSSAALTADFALITGGNAASRKVERYTGEVAPHVPTDDDGNALPFNIVLALGHNDTTYANASFTAAALQARVEEVISGLVDAYPTARLFVVGVMWTPYATPDAAVEAANDAILAACQAELPKINGVLPFIDTLDWITGTGRIGALTGNGNSDVMTDTDNVHPSPPGNLYYGRRIAAAILAILLRNVRAA